jgi:hypothetical protein
MVTNSRRSVCARSVQVVMHMDGWGCSHWLKRDTYRDYVVQEPVQFAGFKIFYHNDTKKGDPLMTPADLLRLSRSRSTCSTSRHDPRPAGYPAAGEPDVGRLSAGTPAGR